MIRHPEFQVSSILEVWMRGDEIRVVNAVRTYLVSQGWQICPDPGFADLLAERDGSRLYVEAKGRTGGNMGLDVDTLYGQLLRGMPEKEVGAARFAVVVPHEGLTAAVRVPRRLGQILGIDVDSDDAAGAVTPAT